jgi:hypothetical protein
MPHRFTHLVILSNQTVGRAGSLPRCCGLRQRFCARNDAVLFPPARRTFAPYIATGYWLL